MFWALTWGLGFGFWVLGFGVKFLGWGGCGLRSVYGVQGSGVPGTHLRQDLLP